MTESFNIYAKRVITDLEDGSVTVSGFDLSQLVAEFSTKELFDAMCSNDQFQTLVDLVAEELESEDE